MDIRMQGFIHWPDREALYETNVNLFSGIFWEENGHNK